MRDEKKASVGMLMIGIAALFLAGFLLLAVFGAQSFRATATGRSANLDERALRAYLATVARANDRSGAITLRHDDAAGDVLIFADGDSGYALRLFCADGALLEDYAAADAPLSRERAQRIGATARFEVVEGDKLIEVYTDAGRVLLHRRSEGGEP